MASTESTFDSEKRGAFLLALERTGEVHAAASAAGVTQSTVWRYRAAHPEFDEECGLALGRLYGTLMGVAKLVAIDGLVTTRRDKDGNVVSEETKYDTKVLLKWLARLDPAWGDRVQVDKTVRTEVVHRKATKPSDVPAEARGKLREALDELRRN